MGSSGDGDRLRQAGRPYEAAPGFPAASGASGGLSGPSVYRCGTAGFKKRGAGTGVCGASGSGDKRESDPADRICTDFPDRQGL